MILKHKIFKYYKEKYNKQQNKGKIFNLKVYF